MNYKGSSSNQASHGDGVGRISPDAIELLKEAAKDNNGFILHVVTEGGTSIQANNREFVQPNNPRLKQRWKSALDELVNHGLVETRDSEIYSTTDKGYQVSDTLN
jgi:hypothetical protein